MTTFRKAIVALSPTPLTRQDSAQIRRRFGADSDFLDLAMLRRRGLYRLLGELRSASCRTLLITGPEKDLRLFRDYLLLLSFFIPAGRRLMVSDASATRRIRLFHAPGAALRILEGMVAGAGSLFRNLLRVRSSAGPTSRQIPKGGPSRCIYLKPTLMFGPTVGGSVGHVAGVANAMSRKEISVRLLSSNELHLLDAEVEIAYIDPPSLISFPYELNQHVYQQKFLAGAIKECREWRPDFIYQRYSLNDLTGVELRRRFGIPLIMEFNGSEVWIQDNWGRPLKFRSLSQRIERRNLEAADLVVTVSEQVKQQVLSMGISEEKVVWYPNCVDTRLFDSQRFGPESRRQVRQGLKVPLDADLFTFVGTFGRWHGTEILAAAIRQLVESSQGWLESKNIHFLLVGDGERAGQVRATLGDAVKEGFVTLTGLLPQDQTPAILAASDVLLSPHAPNQDGTPFFGSPTKLFEYMAMKRIIVASDLDQIGWILRGGSPDGRRNGNGEACAILVRPGSVSSLIEGLRAASEMGPDERLGLASKARSCALQHYTWTRNVEAVLTAFAERLESTNERETGP